MKRRPEAKGVLLALADRCDDDGRNAWPSVATIATESEIGQRTADTCLSALRRYGIIDEQAPPRQHRPRTWKLNLDLLSALANFDIPIETWRRLECAGDRVDASDPQYVATLTAGLDPHDPAALDERRRTADNVPGSQIHPPDPQNRHPDPQDRESGSQHVADDPVLLNCPLNDPLNKNPLRGLSDDERQRSAALLKGHAFDVLTGQGVDQPIAELQDALKAKADRAGIPYEPDMIGAAIAFAQMGRRFAGARRAI